MPVEGRRNSEDGRKNAEKGYVKGGSKVPEILSLVLGLPIRGAPARSLPLVPAGKWSQTGLSKLVSVRGQIVHTLSFVTRVLPDAAL